MRKSDWYLILLGLLSITYGCAECDDEWEGLSTYPIAFTTPSTISRGAEISKSTLPTFQLRAFAYWRDLKESYNINKAIIEPITLSCVSTTSSKYTWSDGNTYYWPLVGYVSFYCYGPYSSTDKSTTLIWTDETPYIKFKVSDNVQNQYDLLTCNANNNMQYKDGAVSFTLRHTLSRIGISIVNSTEKEITDLSASFSGDFCTYGEWKLQNYKNWENRTTEQKTYTPALDVTTLAADGTTQNQSDNYLMLIPPEKAIAITITIRFKIGEKSYIATSTQAARKLAIESSYSYSITLTTASIQEVTTDASAPATRAVAPLEVTTCVEPWK